MNMRIFTLVDESVSAVDADLEDGAMTPNGT
jgi:hypothetical protein